MQSDSVNGGSVARRRLWGAFAWLLAALILLTAWLPPRGTPWSRPAVLVLLLALASEWLVLKRIYHHHPTSGARSNAVKIIMSVLLLVSAILLAVSAMRR
ncbi:MAG TPA: hypothetical protein VKT29_00375 [Terriglobales bacterium]|nr:hypothetical protein [Terriglobales bacterium]